MCRASAARASNGAANGSHSFGHAGATDLDLPRHVQEVLKGMTLGKRERLEGYLRRVRRIEALGATLATASDAQLRAKTAEFVSRIQDDGETLDDILEEAFAVVREVSSRVLGLRHYDVQLVGGMALHDGHVAEMMTGEGKTLVATLPAYLNALEGRGVHIVTVNDYLARRDAEQMGRVYRALGLTVDAVVEASTAERRRQAYACDITYITAMELSFDYLRDFTARSRSQLVLPEGWQNYAIVDEVDSVLIDLCRNPLIISYPDRDEEKVVHQATRIAKAIVQHPSWTEQCYVTNPVRKSVRLTLLGQRLVIQVIKALMQEDSEAARGRGEPHFAGPIAGFARAAREGREATPQDLWFDDSPWGPWVISALTAHYCFLRGEDYILTSDGSTPDDGAAVDGDDSRNVVLVDPSSGRMLLRSRWVAHIHQLVEAKEGVAVKPESRATASVTYQRMFRNFRKLCGMTGTASTEKAELYDVYGLDVVVIPPNRPLIRIDHPPELYLPYPNQDASGTAYVDSSICAVAALVRKALTCGRPVLIGTPSINLSDEVITRLVQLFPMYESQFALLNAKPELVRMESQVVANAGLPGRITVATGMAGRGTDIKLGGDSQGVTLQALLFFFGYHLHQVNSFWMSQLAILPPWVDGSDMAALSRVLPPEVMTTVFRANVIAKAATCNGLRRPCTSADQAEDVLQRVMEDAARLRQTVLARYRRKHGQEAVTQLADDATARIAQMRERYQGLAGELEPLLGQLLPEWPRAEAALQLTVWAGLVGERNALSQFLPSAAELEQEVMTRGETVQDSSWPLLRQWAAMEGEVVRGRSSLEELLQMATQAYDDALYEDTLLPEHRGMENAMVQHFVLAALQLWLLLDPICELQRRYVSDQVGGLMVVLYGMQDSMRIEQQLRGRAGRQGDPGETFTMYSWQHDVRMFDYVSPASLQLINKELTDVLQGPIAALIAEQLRQPRLEEWRSGRKALLDFDLVRMELEQTFQAIRNRAVLGSPADSQAIIAWMVQGHVDALVEQHIYGSKPPQQWPLEALLTELRACVFGQFNSMRMHTCQPEALASTLAVMAQGGSEAFPFVCVEPPFDLSVQGVAAALRSAAAGGRRQPWPCAIDLLALHESGPGFQVGLPQDSMVLAALARHREMVGGHRGGAAGAIDRPAVHGRHAWRVRRLRNLLGEMLLLAYHVQRHLRLQVVHATHDALHPELQSKDAQGSLCALERQVLCDEFDDSWGAFIEDLNNLEKGESIKSMRLNVVDEFAIDSSIMFREMLRSLRSSTVARLFKDVGIIWMPLTNPDQLPFRSTDDAEPLRAPLAEQPEAATGQDGSGSQGRSSSGNDGRDSDLQDGAEARTGQPTASGDFSPTGQGAAQASERASDREGLGTATTPRGTAAMDDSAGSWPGDS